MKTKYRVLFLIAGLCCSNIAVAGRHSIARDEASRIVENRFAQFYRDEALRKKAEADAMNQEIAKAAKIKSDMLRDFEDSLHAAGKSAEEITQAMQDYMGKLNEDYPTNAYGSDSSIGSGSLGGNSAGLGDIWQNSNDSLGPELSRGTTENNPFLFLQELEGKDLALQISGIQEVIASLEGLPGQEHLVSQFIKNLSAISPELAARFEEEYKKYSKSNKEDLNNHVSDDQHGSAAVNATGATKSKTSLKNLTAGQTAGSFNSIMVYNFNPSSLYQIYAAPGKATTIVLAPGEKIIGTPICGDSTKWKIKTMVKGNGAERNWHLVVQPLRSGVKTSITIATDQNRLYVLEATSLEDNYMAVVRWNYV